MRSIWVLKKYNHSYAYITWAPLNIRKDIAICYILEKYVVYCVYIYICKFSCPSIKFHTLHHDDPLVCRPSNDFQVTVKACCQTWHPLGQHRTELPSVPW